MQIARPRDSLARQADDFGFDIWGCLDLADKGFALARGGGDGCLTGAIMRLDHNGGGVLALLLRIVSNALALDARGLTLFVSNIGAMAAKPNAKRERQCGQADW